MIYFERILLIFDKRRVFLFCFVFVLFCSFVCLWATQMSFSNQDVYYKDYNQQRVSTIGSIKRAKHDLLFAKDYHN